MASPTKWSRIIRYVSAVDDKVKLGEPIISENLLEGSREIDLGQLAENGTLEVMAFEGSDIFSISRVTGKDKVKRILGPLDSKDVPIIRCIGLNYKSHILEGGRGLPSCPTVFTKPGPAVADWGEDIPIPKLAQEQCDYEGELTIVIGKDVKNVSAADALEYVAGYTVGNDISSRDWQRDPNKAGPVPQWCFSKSFDKYAPLGPCIVSVDLLGAADNLELSTFVNGELRQKGNTGDLHFGVREIIAFCSQGQTLQKGTLIMTGTPGGVGLFMKPPVFLKDGDEVVVQVEGIGRLVNSIKFE